MMVEKNNNITDKFGKDNVEWGVMIIYKKQERKLILLSFIVAFILGLSFIGRFFSG